MSRMKSAPGPPVSRSWARRRGARRLPLAGAAVLAGLIGLTLLARVYVVRTAAALNADEAIEGLMALHISQARHFPTFFYGQSYFGALEAYLAAALFRLAGFSPMALVGFPVLF